MIERAGLENGEKWTDRSSTPPFRPSSVSPLPPYSSPSTLSPRVLTPPISDEDIPNIYLEGPIPPESDQLMVADSRSEQVLEEEFDEDDEDYDSENDKPVVLSGKVTLSMFSSTGGTAGTTTTHTNITGISSAIAGGSGCGAGPDEITEAMEAPSLSVDEGVVGGKRAGGPKLATAGKVQDLSDALANVCPIHLEFINISFYLYSVDTNKLNLILLKQNLNFKLASIHQNNFFRL